MKTPEHQLPVGEKIKLTGHFDEPILLEKVRPLGSGYECRVRVPDGSLEEAIISEEEAAALAGVVCTATDKVRPVDSENEPHRLGKQASAIRNEVLRLGDDCPWALRRLKENLKDLHGHRLFPTDELALARVVRQSP